jgi:OmpA-OmpF porin, OOP family
MILRIYIIGVFLVLLSLPLRAQQNLVPNGDFEEYDSCPWSFSGIDRNVPYWFTPLSLVMLDSMGSSDYYHECGHEKLTPSNSILGIQIPRSGEAFSGIYLGEYYYRKDWNGKEYIDEYREYIEVELIDKLQAGSKYCFELWYSIGFSMKYASIYHQVSLGILLTDTLVKRSLGTYKYQNGNSDTVPKPINSALAYQEVTPDWLDTLHWIKISGEFIAIGNERYLTIGNFTPEDTITKKQVYVYIDDVSLRLCEKNPEPPQEFLLVFPNPAGEEVSFNYPSIPDNESATLEVLTTHGQLVGKLNLSSGNSQSKINTSFFAQGVYLARLHCSDGKQSSVKFMVRH